MKLRPLRNPQRALQVDSLPVSNELKQNGGPTLNQTPRKPARRVHSSQTEDDGDAEKLLTDEGQGRQPAHGAALVQDPLPLVLDGIGPVGRPAAQLHVAALQETSLHPAPGLRGLDWRNIHVRLSTYTFIYPSTVHISCPHSWFWRAARLFWLLVTQHLIDRSEELITQLPRLVSWVWIGCPY